MSLGPRNIYKVFAGGNHSWVVLDDIIPVREKYRAPSPIPERGQSDSRSPTGRNPSKEHLGQRTASQKRALSNKQRDTNPEYTIDITYSPDS